MTVTEKLLLRELSRALAFIEKQTPSYYPTITRPDGTITTEQQALIDDIVDLLKTEKDAAK